MPARGRQACAAEPGREPSAAGDVDLEAVDRSRPEHAGEIDLVIAVFAGGDVQGQLVLDLPQAFEVVGRDRFFEPGDR